MKKAKESGTPVKHIPQRTCIACRKTGEKRGLIRLVCLPAKEAEVDLTGRKPGRGAYLCNAPKCWEDALKSGKIEHSLRTKLTPENRAKLENYAKGLNNTI
jgi:predicted RNA-binding protein YlxR (DUF448 family)